jgi:hypothetical protein
MEGKIFLGSADHGTRISKQGHAFFVVARKKKTIVVWLPFPLAVNEESTGAGMVCPVLDFLNNI